MKVCPRCKHIQPDSAYHKDKNRTDGLSGYCKVCNNKRTKEDYLKIPPDVRRYKEYLRHIKRSYCLCEEDVRELMDKQKGCCKVCGRSLVNPSHKKTDMNIDHDHKTGKVRGLLCVTCNFTIGQLEIKGRLEELMRYLNE